MRKVHPYRFVPQTSYTVEQFGRCHAAPDFPLRSRLFFLPRPSPWCHPDLLPGVTPTFSPVMAQKLLPDLEMGGWFDVNMTEYKTEQHALAFRSGSD